ncbi:MAG TPA: sensor histidine kinase [Chryseolinea sp.]|nr:sensor histidine kinase [Chryseolinea sp.]
MKILYAMLLCFCCLCAKSQQNKIDSLKRLLPTVKDDSTKYEILFRLATAYVRVDYKVSRVLYDSILRAIDGNKKFKVLEADVLLGIGGLGFDHGDYPLSIEYYAKAAEKYNALSGNYKASGLAAVYNNLGGILSLTNDWEGAQKYYLMSIKELEKLYDTTRMVTVYFNIAFVFTDMDEWTKSYESMYKSFQLSARSSNKSQNMQSCSRLATICFKTKRVDEGLTYLKIVDSLIPKAQENIDFIYYHHAYGTYYQQTGRYAAAVNHHKLAYKAAIKWDDPYYLAEETLEIGNDYLKLHKFDSAEFYFQKSYDISQQYKYKPKVLLSLISLSDLEEAKGNLDKAYSYKKKQASYADSLVKEQNQYRILLIDGEFAAEKKSNEIAQLQKDKQIQALSLEKKSTINYILVSSIIALVVFGFLVYRNLRHRHTLAKQQEELHRQRIRELEKDRQLIAVDSMLKGQEEERSRMAKDLHDGLGGMLSGVKLSLGAMKGNIILSEANTRLFASVLDQLDHSINEMRRVAHNMMPEALVKLGLQQAIQDYCDGLNESTNLKFNTQFYGLEKRLDTASEIVVYRIVQELLNNVVKHADASEVLVQLMQHEKNLNITIEDNGRGFIVSEVDDKRSVGLNNVRSRVDYLKGQLDIKSTPGAGTSIHIECAVQDA